VLAGEVDAASLGGSNIPMGAQRGEAHLTVAHASGTVGVGKGGNMSEREEDRGTTRDRRREEEILDELMRLLRTDAEIMESVRDMVRTAADETARRPSVLFQAALVGEEGGEAEGGGQGVPAASVIGGIGAAAGGVLGGLLDLVKSEKDFIQRLILKLLGL
jgi:hypothetical protein